MDHKEKKNKIVELIEQFLKGVEKVYPHDELDPNLFVRLQTICTLIDAGLKETYKEKRRQTVIDGIEKQESQMVDECLSILETQHLSIAPNQSKKILH